MLSPTSGTLIQVRFLAGWEFTEETLKSADWIVRGSADGVAMGGDLSEMPDGASAPTFMVWAMKDLQSGNLDRIQR